VGLHVKLERLPVFAVGGTVRVVRHRVRRGVLLGRQRLPWMPLLKLDDVGPADPGSHPDHLLRRLKLSPVITADFGNDPWTPHRAPPLSAMIKSASSRTQPSPPRDSNTMIAACIASRDASLGAIPQPTRNMQGASGTSLPTYTVWRRSTSCRRDHSRRTGSFSPGATKHSTPSFSHRFCTTGFASLVSTTTFIPNSLNL